MNTVAIDTDLALQVGRVVVSAARFETALASIGYAILGGDDKAHAKTHALSPSRLGELIEPLAHDSAHQWWSEPVLDLLTRSEELLEARNMVVHGQWTDVRGLHEGRSFVTFKPDRKSKSWSAGFYDIEQLTRLGDDLAVLADEARGLGDRMIEEAHR